MYRHILIAVVFLLGFPQPLFAQTQVAPIETNPPSQIIEIDPVETKTNIVNPVCDAPCNKSGDLCVCPQEPTCENPCVKQDGTCICPLPAVKTCKIGCLCDDDKMTCPSSQPLCNPPCFLSNGTCSCPTEPSASCPINCSCNDKTIICQTLQANPIETEITSIESGIKPVSIEKSNDQLLIKTSSGQSFTKEKLIITNNKLTVNTESGDKEIKLLPEEALSKVNDLSRLNEIRLQAELKNIVYIVNGIKRAKILFIFPIEYEMTTKVDAQTGQILSTDKPWWSFLAN